MYQLSPPDLGDILDFTPADLAANREGVLTQRQLAKLREEDAEETKSLLFGVAILLPLVLVGCGLCAALVNVGAVIAWAGDALPVIGAVAAVIAGLVAWANFQGRRERYRQPPVAQAEGTLDLLTDYRDNREFYYAVIADRRFRLDGMTMEGLRAFTAGYPEGQQYRLYYAPRAGKLLSGEVIG